MVQDKAEITGLRLPWAGKQVSTENIETELSHFWRMAADNVRISQNIHVRTSVLNFVICAPDVESARYASTLIRDFSSTHIARVILLILDPHNATSGVSTWVTLRSFSIISDLMRHHFEQITIMVSGAAVYETSHMLEPLLKPDLPVYLWWLHDLPTDTTIFSRLITVSNRVIIDSSSFEKPKESICALPSLIQAVPTCAFSDLNWGRITSWRELIAQFFDVVEYKPYLAGVSSIEIEHTVSPSIETEQVANILANPLQALFLAAWLKARLGWQLTVEHTLDENASAMHNYSWSMSRPSGSLTGLTSEISTEKANEANALPAGSIILRPRIEPDTQAGTLCFVRLYSTFDGQNATFSIDRDDEFDHVLTSVQLDQITRPPRTVSIADTHKKSNLLHDELEIMGRDHLYEETLDEVLALLTGGCA